MAPTRRRASVGAFLFPASPKKGRTMAGLPASLIIAIWLVAALWGIGPCRPPQTSGYAPGPSSGPVLRDRSVIESANAAKKATEKTEAKASAAIMAAFPIGCPLQISETGNVTIASARETIATAPRIASTFWRDTNRVAMSRPLSRTVMNLRACPQGYRITLIRKVARPGAQLPYGARSSVLKVLSAMARAPTTPHSGMDLS